jgi:hypothetical protein
VTNSTKNYLIHPLDGARARVARANEHLTNLRQRLAGILRSQEDAIIVEFDPNPPHQIILRRPNETFVETDVGILIGEIVYNLRTALDYLVFELAKFDSGVSQDFTQFPIEDTKKGFAWREKRGWLKGINTAHVAAIERLQPYAGCDWTKTLRDLSNRDKHKGFARIGGSFTAHSYSRIHTSHFDAIQAPIRRAIHPVHGEVDVKLHFTATVELTDGPPIIEALEIVKLKVAETLEAFKPEFQRT